MSGKKIGRFVNTVMTFLMFLVLITILLMVLSMRASGGEANLFGYQLKTVLSGSMEPDIPTGSVIAMKETQPNYQYKTNEIITFRTNEEKIVTHRIEQVQEDNKSYITKGDANDAADLEPVRQENIVGVYSGFMIPYLGYITNFVHSGQGTALFLVIPGIGLVVYAFLLFRRALCLVKQEKKSIHSETKN